MRIFLSHSSRDYEAAEQLRDWLGTTKDRSKGRSRIHALTCPTSPRAIHQSSTSVPHVPPGEICRISHTLPSEPATSAAKSPLAYNPAAGI